MASKSIGGFPTKPSFAKVAAMAPPAKTKSSLVAQQPTIPLSLESLPEKVTITKSAAAEVIRPATVDRVEPAYAHAEKMKILSKEIGDLTLVNNNMSHNQSSNLQDLEDVRGPDSTEDDQSHLSGSSTKPPSFDTKSMASVTTFAMDEKESIRPDDSASVQAAEEEESFSAPASGAASSHVGSDAGISQFRVQSRDGYNVIGAPPRRFPMTMLANPPRFGEVTIEAPHSGEPCPALTTGSIIPPLSDPPRLSVTPDEKLLEAMGTPKDRLLLLQMEEKILAFITQSRDEFFDLPPQNSFGRLLAHKLADYYNLSHYITGDNSSVRLYRTQFCRLPTPLGLLASSMPENPVPPTGSAAFKIMRRTLGPGKQSAGNSTPASSSVPSKATSEAGADTTSDEGLMSPLEITPPKDKSKWTREEKEAHYKAARERIFKDFQEPTISENTSAGETSATMSRSSSSSGKKKSHKQRTPKDDSFEARSQFIPGYPGMTFTSSQNHYDASQGGSSLAPPYTSSHSNTNNAPSVNYSTTPTQAYSGYDSPMGYNGIPGYQMGISQQYGANEGWTGPQSPQPGGYYNFGPNNQPPSMYPHHTPVIPPHAMGQYPGPAGPNFQPSNPSWTQTPYQGSYQQQPMMNQNSAPVHWPNFPPQPVSSPPPYQFGQLPPQSYASTPPPNSQHPIPGSFNRSIFNPQTRSFVPGGSTSRTSGKTVLPKHPHHFSAPTSNGNSPHQANPETTSSGSPSPWLPQMNSNGAPSANPHQESLQKKWGTPAHLPKKPPPSQVPSAFDMESASPLPSQQAYQTLTTNGPKGGPLIVSGSGGGFPTSMNGGLAAGP